MPPSQERMKGFRMWALASEALGLCLASATPRACGFQQVPQTLCLGFLICRMGRPWYPAPRLMTRMTRDRGSLHHQCCASSSPCHHLCGHHLGKSTFSKTRWVADWFTAVVFFFLIPFSLLNLWRLCADFADLGRTLTPWPQPSLCLFSLHL